MKTYWLLVFCTALSPLLLAQQYKNVAALDVQGAKEIQFDHTTLKNEIEVWDEDYIKLDITIHSNLPKKVLENFLAKGRYQIMGKKSRDHYVIFLPNTHIPLQIFGQKVRESISVKYYTPGYYMLDESNIVRKNITDEMLAQIRARCACTPEELVAEKQRVFAIQEICEVNIYFKSTCSDGQVHQLKNYKFTMDGRNYSMRKLKFPKVN